MDLYTIDGGPIGTGIIMYFTAEQISFFVTDSPKHPLILRNPWLHKHNPNISWSTMEIEKWSDFCHQNCLLKTSLLIALTSVEVLIYHPLYLSHQNTQTSVRLKPVGFLFIVHTTVLSTSCLALLHHTIKLKQGYIVPSTLPASAGFLFMEKKEAAFRPCINYQGLNDITVKYPYPLPLVPSALEQLCSAIIFSKMDLRSSYNLIRIKEDDEWKPHLAPHQDIINTRLCYMDCSPHHFNVSLMMCSEISWDSL